MKKTSKKIMIIALVVLLLALAIGYAAFSDTLKISGTANANGTFNLEFTAASIAQNDSFNYSGSSATFNDPNNLVVKIADLAYPGAGTTVTATITNKGTISANLKEVKINQPSNAAIIVEYPAELKPNHKIAPGKTCTITFVVKWDSTSEVLASQIKEVTFGAELIYEQNTTPFSGTTSHQDA